MIPILIVTVLAAAQTASTWPTQMEGVRIVLETDPAPKCEVIKKGKVYEGRASTRDEAFRALALKVKAKGADTVQLERVYIRNPGGIRVARGRGYRCGTAAAEEGKP